MELGKKGLGTTAPNPMVGCVIVHDGKIIGEGFTSPYGGPHAEVNAINAVKNKSLLAKATLYVSLEPCSHHGKTPPCSDFIIKHKIPRVVIGIEDPHEKVAGKGIQRLNEAGCEVTVGILQETCRSHHKRFLCFHEKKRPYIILKWAETQDGFIAPISTARGNEPKPFWISNRFCKQRVHQWRSQEQAILVGTETVLKDNPKLTTRDWIGKSPIRIVLDRNLRIPSSFRVFDGLAKTLVFTEITDTSKYVNTVDYEVIDFSKPIGSALCKVLHQKGISSLIVEGGSKTLQSFIDEGLWDEARIFTGPTRLKKGLAAPKISGKLDSVVPILTDTLSIYHHD